MELTLASYNIHSGIGTDRRFDLYRVADVLQEVAADVIALQEVGDFRGRTSSGEHPEDLARLLGMHMAFGPNVIVNERRYGNAVLSRLPIRKSRNYDLSVAGREPRGALRCDLELGDDKTLHVFCVHLGLSFRERREQEALLLSSDILREAVRSDPVLICGDFNYWRNSGVSSLVRGAVRDAAMMLGAKRATYPSRFPVMRLDRVFVDAGVRPLTMHVHRSERALLASDHLPLVLRFEAPARERMFEQAYPVEMVG